MSKRKVLNSKILKKFYLKDRMSSGDIVDKYGCTRTTVCRHLRTLGIIRPESGSNSRNRNFKKKQHRGSYPVTFLPKHKRANNLGCVFDHVLEISKKLGYVPDRSTPIHHIDLDKENSNVTTLHLYKNQKKHHALHKQLDDIIRQLIKNNITLFKDDKYHLKL